MNRRAKCDAASFILGGEIRNRTNTHTHKVNDISTRCLWACVDDNAILVARNALEGRVGVLQPVNVGRHDI